MSFYEFIELMKLVFIFIYVFMYYYEMECFLEKPKGNVFLVYSIGERTMF